MIGLVELQKALEELMINAPDYEELDSIGGMESFSVQMWGSRVEAWIAKVKELLMKLFQEQQAKVSVDRKQLSELWAKQPPFPMNVTYRGSLEEWLENLKELLEARGKDEK